MSAAAFIIAVWQIRKTQSAAESAAQAATEAREVVQQVTSVTSLSQASERIDLLKEIIRNQQWQRAVDRYAELRKLLINVEVRLSEENKVKFGANLGHATRQLLIMEYESNEAIGGKAGIDVARFQRMLLRIQNDIDMAHAELEQELAHAP